MEYDRVVSEFFLNTCRLRPPLNVNDIAVLTETSRLLDAAATSDNERDFIPLSTGSVAEFYIE